MAVPGVRRSGGACQRLSLLCRGAVVLRSDCTNYATAECDRFIRGEGRGGVNAEG